MIALTILLLSLSTLSPTASMLFPSSYHFPHLYHHDYIAVTIFTAISSFPSSQRNGPFETQKISKEVAQTCGSLLGSFATACSSLRSLSSARDCAGCRGVFAQASRGARDPSGDQSPPSDLRLISSRPSQAEGLRPGGGTGLQAGEGNEGG